jgi:hypothetical protein
MREYGASRARPCTERAGRRAPHAERAVMLPAVQSLRLACSEGRTPTGSCVMLLGTGGAASGSRDPRLVTGRPYGTGACGERGLVGRRRAGVLRTQREL